jgi:hypothetical protein
MGKSLSFHDVLPEYPATVHLPWKANSKGDKIASERDAEVIFQKSVFVQEKVDGANCGMAYLDGHPVVRSRSKILRKGQPLKNPSQKQFSSAWNWMHQNRILFTNLADAGPFSVYGEWMVMQHGMEYDFLPNWFLAFDLYDWERGLYLAADKSAKILLECGFESVPMVFCGKLDSYEQLEARANEPSAFSPTQKREGLIVKTAEGEFLDAKFKMVRQGFDQGCLLDDFRKNRLS